MVIIAATVEPFGTVINDRLGTFNSGSQDGSGQERLSEFVTLWDQWDSGMWGNGFTIVDTGIAGAMPIDGMIVTCWVTMGIVVGLVCLAALLWAICQPVWIAARLQTREPVVLGALAFGTLVQFSLAGIAVGELGFLFWTFAALAWIEAQSLTAS